MNRQTIWQEKQNKLTLIVEEISSYIFKYGLRICDDKIYEILLRRGVFKWFSARRKIIQLKDSWKKRTQLSLEAQKKSTGPRVNYWRGYRKALEECREELRIICHGPRWEAPNNDPKAIKWLKENEK